MNFEDASKLLNDLAYVIIPFDRTQSQFQSLISKTKTLLKSQTGATKMYPLVEGMLRLNLDDGLPSLVRKQIEEGNFSRDAYDISICLHFFGRLYTL